MAPYAPYQSHDTGAVLFGRPGADRRALDLAAPFRDVPIFNRWNPPNSGTLTDIRQPLRGVGFTGALPPGARLLMVPWQYRQVLADVLDGVYAAPNITNGRTYWPMVGGAYGDSNAASPTNSILPEPVIVLRQGDVVEFGTLLQDGVSVATVTPWLSLDILNWPQATRTQQGTHYLPQTRAVVRVFREGARLPASLGWDPVAALLRNASTIVAAPANADETTGFYIPPDATHVTLHMVDDSVNTPARIQGAETGNYDVWWNTDGVWMHNQQDDFDAAGRGAADATHDVETYIVPHNVTKISVWLNGGGNNFYTWMIITQQLNAR